MLCAAGVRAFVPPASAPRRCEVWRELPRIKGRVKYSINSRWAGPRLLTAWTRIYLLPLAEVVQNLRMTGMRQEECCFKDVVRFAEPLVMNAAFHMPSKPKCGDHDE